MNFYFIFRIFYGVFFGLVFVIGGIFIVIFKGEFGIGFRIGYIYFSEWVRERVNRIIGIGLIVFGCYLCFFCFFCCYMVCLFFLLGELLLFW